MDGKSLMKRKDLVCDGRCLWFVFMSGRKEGRKHFTVYLWKEVSAVPRFCNLEVSKPLVNVTYQLKTVWFIS